MAAPLSARRGRASHRHLHACADEQWLQKGTACWVWSSLYALPATLSVKYQPRHHAHCLGHGLVWPPAVHQQRHQCWAQGMLALAASKHDIRSQQCGVPILRKHRQEQQQVSKQRTCLMSMLTGGVLKSVNRSSPGLAPSWLLSKRVLKGETALPLRLNTATCTDRQTVCC